MTKSDLVANFLEGQFNLPVKRGTYRRNNRDKEENENVCRWQMDVDMEQFPEWGTPRDQCRKIQVANVICVKGRSHEENIASFGLYDEYFDNSLDYVVGSDYTLKDILDAITLYGTSYVFITYKDGFFYIDINKKPLSYKGDFRKCEIEAMMVQ